ncbi:hypothetical protein C8J56DRAFT_1063512 [Mycena floridula]|nr:hypothetical protein C8J56DRAFT_1063512 [Mycena floridula]
MDAPPDQTPGPSMNENASGQRPRTARTTNEAKGTTPAKAKEELVHQLELFATQPAQIVDILLQNLKPKRNGPSADQIFKEIKLVSAKIDALTKTVKSPTYASVAASSTPTPTPLSAYKPPRHQAAAPPTSPTDICKEVKNSFMLTIKIKRVDQNHLIHSCKPETIISTINAALQKVPDTAHISAKSARRLKTSKDIRITF